MRLNPLLINNGQSAAKLRIGEGPTTIPSLGVEHKRLMFEMVRASLCGEDIVCALLKNKDCARVAICFNFVVKNFF